MYLSGSHISGNDGSLVTGMWVVLGEEDRADLFSTYGSSLYTSGRETALA